MTPNTPATMRDIERLEHADERIWEAVEIRALKGDVTEALKGKADAVIVERIERSVGRLVWIGLTVAIGLLTTGAGLIANLIANG